MAILTDMGRRVNALRPEGNGQKMVVQDRCAKLRVSNLYAWQARIITPHWNNGGSCPAIGKSGEHSGICGKGDLITSGKFDTVEPGNPEIPVPDDCTLDKGSEFLQRV